jgi:predicted lipid-binding transport protein (Tim44 family)
VFGIFALGIVAIVIWAGIQAVKYRARKRERAQQVAAASLAAAEDDAAFHPETVRQWAEYLFREAQAAWDARDRDRLAKIVGGDLLQEWKRRLDDFDRKGWHNRVHVKSVKTEYLHLVNRAADQEDRVVVRIEATMDDYVVNKHGQRINHKEGEGTERKLAEWWTLAKRDNAWVLHSIEQEAEGRHNLDQRLVTRPDEDHRLHDEALVALAAQDKVLDGYSIAEVADLDFDGDARAAALDLSLADGRFAPDVLEVAVRRAVAGWVEAVDGEDAALEEVASPGAVQQLLHPNDPSRRTRLVVRGLQLRGVRIAALDAAAQPPAMTVEVHVVGRRYVEDRDTAAVVSGSQSAEVAFTERWQMALNGRDDRPWKVVDAQAPAFAAV